jgi:uncharacterized membrane protein HdeD (DUF308 family)
MTMIFARNWWAMALRGLCAVLFGLAAFVWPRITLEALVGLFAAYVLLNGIFAIVIAIRAAEHKRGWWLLLVLGVVSIAAGVLTFLWPGITALALLFLIATWAVITGIFEIAVAIEMRRVIQGEWLLGLNGLVSICFGLFLFLWPRAGALAVVWIIGFYALLSGCLFLTLAFRLRHRPQFFDEEMGSGKHRLAT